MSKKKKQFQKGLAYSTDPDLEWDGASEEEETPDPSVQRLRISLDTRQRKGKVVTLIEGFIGQSGDLKKLEKDLKIFCGTGGSSKDGEIIIQGDVREKVKGYLREKGYKVK